MQFLKRNKKQLLLIVKILVLVASIFMIKKKLFDDHDFLRSFAESDVLNLQTAKYLFIILIFMVLNWLLEAIKWKYLVFQVERQSVTESVYGILKGIYLGLITPNRIGEGLGKVDSLKPKSRARGSYAFFVGSASQLIVTSLFGCLALWMSEKVFIKNRDVWFAIKTLATLLTVFILIAYYYPKWRSILASWISTVFKTNAEIKYTPHQLNNILTLSLMRYVLFSFQFFLALKIFGFSVDVVNSFLAILMTYAFTTWIPSFLLGDLGLREGVALVIFGMFTTQLNAVFMASLLVWIINLLIPALVGMYLFTFKKKPSS